MKKKEIRKREKAWGNKPCEHPKLVQIKKTAKYCASCGRLIYISKRKSSKEDKAEGEAEIP